MTDDSAPADVTILAQLPAAIERGKTEPLAERVFYDTERGYVFVHCSCERGRGYPLESS